MKEYATHDFDAVLNLYYAKARFYDADNRRFTAVDPILDPSRYDLREYVTDPMQLVQTLYVKDNAINWIDPLGLWSYNDLYNLAQLVRKGVDISMQISREMKTKNNPFLIFHQLAQVLWGVELIKAGCAVDFEYGFKANGALFAKNERADIVASKGTYKYLYEIKPRWIAVTKKETIRSMVETQMSGYFEFMKCIQRESINSGMAFSLDETRKYEPIKPGFKKEYSLISTDAFSLSLRLEYFGNGVVGYTPVYQSGTKQPADYRVKEVDSILRNNLYLLHPEMIPVREGVYTRPSGLLDRGSTDIITDISKYSDLEYARIVDAAQATLLDNGVELVGGALTASAVLVVGAVAIDAGVVAGASLMADVTSGAKISAKVIADKALNALAIGSQGVMAFAEKIAEGAAPIIGVATRSGLKYFVVTG